MKHIDVDLKRCTGCAACVQVCPTHAIEFQEDSYGFFYPHVNEQLCVGCGKCLTSCQLLSQKSNNEIHNAFAVQNRDAEILKDSTSGGVFSGIASCIFKHNGVVYGCVFDEHCKAVYKRADCFQSIAPMRGSKYVWADASSVYPQIKHDLENGIIVLFTGIPCQVHGLLLYLGKKYSNLYTLDFLCGGAPSPKVFEHYIQSIASEQDRDNLNFRFRDKHYGVGYCISYNCGGKKTYKRPEFSAYFYLFQEKYIQRNSCYQCQYRGIHRYSDFTMGDYWGIEQVFKDMDCPAGVSFIITNTEKGDTFLHELPLYCEMRNSCVENIARKNIIRCDDSVKMILPPNNRDKFFTSLNKYGWHYAALKYTMTFKRVKKMIFRLLNH